MSGRDSKAKGAADKAHSSRLFVGQFLSRAAQRGVDRTANQRAATVAIFKALYSSSPPFRLVLSAVASRERPLAPNQRNFDFVGLQDFIAGGKDLASEKLDSPVLRAADRYIRYFLFSFAANFPKYANYKTEILQLPGISRKTGLIARYNQILKTATGQARKTALSELRVQLSGTMDPETLTASILYLRRWTLEHVKRKRLSQWKPGAVTPLPKRAAVVPRPAARVTAKVPVVMAVGDSITALGRYVSTLQKTLGEKFRGARAVAYGKRGESLPQIASRFRRTLARMRGYNTVIIQGGVNGITDMPVSQAQKAVIDMITAASAKGMTVIILGITPWAGWKAGKWQLAQTRTIELNNWMRTSLPRRFKGLVYVDTSPLGEPMSAGSKVLKLKRQYDNGDGLHLNFAGHDLLARLIAQAAYNIAPKPVSAKDELQQWAAKHWKSLKDDLYKAVEGRRPADILRISKNLPSGRKSLEDSLRILKRDDIQRAYDEVFNNLMKEDSDFIRYCKSGMRKYREGRLVEERVRMTAATKARDRRFMAMTIKKYINHQAAQKTALGAKLRGDLRQLLISNLNLGSSTLPERSPAEDVKTLAAVAVYRWRWKTDNRNKDIGAWQKSLRTVPTRAAPRTVPGREAPPTPREKGRRKTLHINI